MSKFWGQPSWDTIFCLARAFAWVNPRKTPKSTAAQGAAEAPFGRPVRSRMAKDVIIREIQGRDAQLGSVSD